MAPETEASGALVAPSAIASSAPVFDAERAGLIAAEDEALIGPFLQGRRARAAGIPACIMEFATTLTRGSAWLRRYGALTLLETDGGDLRRAQTSLHERGTPAPGAILLRANSEIATPAPDWVYSVLTLKNGPSKLYLDLLHRLIARVAPGGGVLLRLPVRLKPGLTETPDLDNYIRTIPLEIIYELLRHYGYSLMLAETDQHILTYDTVYFRLLAIRAPFARAPFAEGL